VHQLVDPLFAVRKRCFRPGDFVELAEENRISLPQLRHVESFPFGGSRLFGFFDPVIHILSGIAGREQRLFVSRGTQVLIEFGSNVANADRQFLTGTQAGYVQGQLVGNLLIRRIHLPG
jgi:hypothetical protein